MKCTSHTHPRQGQNSLLSKTHSQMFFDLDFGPYFEKMKFIAKAARRKTGIKFVAA